MRKNYIYLCTTGILLLTLTACGKKTEAGAGEHQLPQQPLRLTEEEMEEMLNSPADPLFTEYEEEYDVDMWTGEEKGIEQPAGICVAEDAVFICDFKGNCIVELDLDGNYVASYGELGAEEGNFSEPTAITYHDGELYVLDRGNSRVQIFDPDMNYQREVPYIGYSFGKNEGFADIAVDKEGTIYLSTLSCWIDNAAIGYISENGKAVKLTPKTLALLTEYQGEIYAISEKTPCYIGDYGQTALPGYSFLLTCSQDGLEQIGELPYKYMPADFCIVDDVVYAISLNSYDVQMNRLHMDGTLDSVVHIFPTEEIDYAEYTPEELQSLKDLSWYLAVVNDDLIYAVDYQRGMIYHLQKVK